jgi:outer membrane protein TolC
MKGEILLLGSTGCQPFVVGSLPTTPGGYAKRHCRERSTSFSAGCRKEQAGSLYYPESGTRCAAGRTTLKFFTAIFMAWLAHTVPAVTLQDVMQTALEKNPAIQEAKAALEQAAGQRLVFRSLVWPQAEAGVPAGIQFGHRAGESGLKGFAVGRGSLDQALFNMSVPASLRRGDVEVLLAQQQLNVAVTEQLHAARLAFYAALYNRALESIRREQQQRLQENAATQRTRYEAGLTDRSAFTSATIQATELEPQIEAAHRAYLDAQLQLAQAMGIDPAKEQMPQPEGQLQFVPKQIDLSSETAAALERRADLKLARLFVRAANEDQKIIAAGYYPAVTGGFRGEYVPVTGIHRQGSTSRTQDFIGSEIRERAAYTWQVVDNGKTGGPVLKARSVREINELSCRKLEANIPRELARIVNWLKSTEERERSVASASESAEESARVIQQNVTSGLASPLEYRITQNEFLQSKSGLLDAVYQHNLAVAEWDRATGRYFQFSYQSAPPEKKTLKR